jgi:hypothetical protein
MSLYSKEVEVWKVPKSADLVRFLAQRIPNDAPKWLFFTEERSLEEILAAKADPWLANATWYPGEQVRLSEILDRVLFYELISSKNIADVPRTVSGECDPLSLLGQEFFFRYRRTWVRGRKTPRIRLIKNRTQLEMAISSGRAAGYEPADWCYQEVLSLAPHHNVSVCGWHGPKTKRYAATRKLLQFPERQGNGDVCELIELSPALSEITQNLLNELGYTGPFELEFVRDPRTGRDMVIELNPRFWMQHPLAGANLDQALVRSYLGLENAKATGSSLQPRYWVNTIVTLNRLLRADLRSWRYLRSQQAILMPPLAVTLRWLPRFSVNLMLRKLRSIGHLCQWLTWLLFLSWRSNRHLARKSL